VFYPNFVVLSAVTNYLPAIHYHSISGVDFWGNILHMTLPQRLDMGQQLLPLFIMVSPPMQWRRNEFESNGRGAPVRRESGGTDLARNAGKKFLVVPLHFFGSKSTICRFGEIFS